MDDIVPGLLEAIQSQFDEKTFNSVKLKNSLKRLSDQKATYIDVNDFAIEVGEILADVLGANITAEVLPDGKMYFNIADRILNPTMQKNFELVNGFAEDVQSELNKEAGIKLKAQSPVLNQDRIDGIINRVSSEADFDAIKWLLQEPIINFTQSVVDDAIKANVDFHARAGLNPTITRTVKGKACDWCKNLAGTYVYYEEPENVYQRHDRCRCTVEYNPKDSRGIQDSHSKRWRDPQKDAKIEARKQIGKVVERVEVSLQEQLDFIDPLTGEKSFIPKDAVVKNSKTIAQGREIRIVNRLVDTYGGRLPNWKKRVGKVESDRFMHDVHWYENKERQYETKVKFRKEKPDENN